MEITETVCPDHFQPFQLKAAGAPFTCSGCRELGFGPRHRCETSACSHALHEECTNPVASAFHEFFPRSYFELCTKPPGYRTRYCDACGKDVKGFVYHCYRTDYDLHPCCLNLKRNIADEEEGNVTLKLSDKVPWKCAKCKRRSVDGVNGTWSYYVSGSDKTCYHVSCVKELILEKWKRGYFSQQVTTNYSGSSSGNNNNNSDSHQLVAAVTSMEIVRSTTIRKYTKIAVVIFKLIFSAIFGNPVSAIATLVEALVSN